MDSPSSPTNVLDTNWKCVFNSNTSMIGCFKNHIVQILGFDFYHAHTPTIPMAVIKLLLAISTLNDMDLFSVRTPQN